MPIGADAAQTSLIVRVHGDPERARLALVERLAAIDPNTGEVTTLRTITFMVAYVLRIAFWLTLVLGALALVLTLSGLFSVLSYLVEQRGREIGVRMALGAALLATFAPIGSVVRLFDPVSYAVSLLCILTACACATLIPALRAVRSDPVAALRQD